MPFKDNFDNFCINDFVYKIKVYISYNKTKYSREI